MNKLSAVTAIAIASMGYEQTYSNKTQKGGPQPILSEDRIAKNRYLNNKAAINAGRPSNYASLTKKQKEKWKKNNKNKYQ